MRSSARVWDEAGVSAEKAWQGRANGFALMVYDAQGLAYCGSWASSLDDTALPQGACTGENIRPQTYSDSFTVRLGAAA